MSDGRISSPKIAPLPAMPQRGGNPGTEFPPAHHPGTSYRQPRRPDPRLDSDRRDHPRLARDSPDEFDELDELE